LKRERNQLYSIKVGGEELLQAPVRLNFWRALTDNDRGSRQGSRLGCWRDAGNTPGIYNNTCFRIEGFKVLEGGKRVIVTSSAVVRTEDRNQRQLSFTPSLQRP
jgi:beta-galactosidase